MNNKEKAFKSMMEFEKEFLPNKFAEYMEKKPKDAHALGVNWAKESLEKISKKLDD